MNSSSLQVFSIFINCNRAVYKTKKYSEQDLYKLSFAGLYNSSNKFIVNNCVRIYNEIENGYYSYRDLVIYVLYSMIFSRSIKYKEIDIESVRKIREIFTNNELIRNKKIILSINKAVKFKSVEEFFSIKNGESYVYDLIKKKYISPIFCVKYESYFSGNDESEEHFRFRKILKLMRNNYLSIGG